MQIQELITNILHAVQRSAPLELPELHKSFIGRRRDKRATVLAIKFDHRKIPHIRFAETYDQGQRHLHQEKTLTLARFAQEFPLPSADMDGEGIRTRRKSFLMDVSAPNQPDPKSTPRTKADS